MELHPLEQKVLEGLKKLNGSGNAVEVASAAGIEKIQAERFGYSLSQKGLVKLEKKVEKQVELTELGKEYVESGLPESRVLKDLLNGKNTLVNVGKKLDLDMKELSAIVGIMKRNAWVAAIPGGGGLELELTGLGKDVAGKKLSSQVALETIASGGAVDEKIISDFKRRSLVVVDKKPLYELELTAKAGKVTADKTEHQLTHELLVSGKWREKKFRKYDLKAQVPAFYGGRLHPLTIAKNRIRRIFLDMGFMESEGPLVESSFWNFDALFQPQDHPARDLADTFYMKEPKSAKLPNAKIVSEVKNAHERGTPGSMGWRYSWKEALAKKPVLRTHTTAVTCRALQKIKPPAKVFCIGHTFRNETVDFKHLPEFSQIDGIVADENVTFRDLLGYLKEFFYRLGFEKIRFRPAYFPYTEMSVEPEVWMEEKKEWIELGGSGIFRPEVTEPLGIDVPVLAWGLSLERPIMLRLGLKDIRNFYYKNDLKWLREVPL